MTHHERRLRRAIGALLPGYERADLLHLAIRLDGVALGLQLSRHNIGAADDRICGERMIRHARRLEGHAERTSWRRMTGRAA